MKFSLSTIACMLMFHVAEFTNITAYIYTRVLINEKRHEKRKTRRNLNLKRETNKNEKQEVRNTTKNETTNYKLKRETKIQKIALLGHRILALSQHYVDHCLLTSELRIAWTASRHAHHTTSHDGVYSCYRCTISW